MHCSSFAAGTPTWDIWAAVSPLAPMKTMARAEEMLRGDKNTFCELSSSPNILNKLMAKVPFASPKSSIREGLLIPTEGLLMDDTKMDLAQ